MIPPTAENSPESARKRRPLFPKASAATPGGRPKGLVTGIREQTKDGEEPMRFTLRVLRRGDAGGKAQGDRLDAATWLADRGSGRPGQAIEHTGRDGEALTPIAPMVVAEVEDGSIGESGNP